MKKIIVSLTALSAAVTLHAQTVYSFGPNTDYVTFGSPLHMEDGTTDALTSDLSRGFNTTSMAPGGYTGPDFFGGWSTTGSVNQNFDFQPQVANDSNLVGGFDGLVFTLNNTTGSTGTFDLLMMGTIAATDIGNLNSFTLGTEAGSSAPDTAGRAVIRIGSSYYISESTTLDSDSTYATDLLAFTTWSNYDPATNISIIGSAATLNATDQVDAVGFLLENDIPEAYGTGNYRIGVGEFTVTAVPEPSSYALISGALALGWIMVRRRS